MELSRAKGTRDFLPEEKIVRNGVVDTLKGVFEKYGFNPVETPLLERFDVLSSKYAGGAEILKETFRLKDQGGREIGLRYDLTVPFARLIAMNKGLRMPFKRYSVGRAFRDGPLKTGRYREFWQCDVDIVGCGDYVADAEILSIVKDVFCELDVEVEIRVNDRRVLDAIVEKCGIDSKNCLDVILVLDKLDKIGVENVKKELKNVVGVDDKICDLLLENVLCEGSSIEKLEIIEKLVGKNEGMENLKKIFDELDGVNFSPCLARGLAYYTGTVFEVYLKDKSFRIKSSLAGGGRYDKMVGDFIGDGKEYPTVGIAFGLDVITDVLKLRREKKEEKVKNVVSDVYVVSIGCFDDARKIVKKFRTGGIKTDIDLLDRGVSKNLNYASKSGIKYVVFVGKRELEEKKVKLKDMESGEEKLMTVNGCFKFLVSV